MRWELEFFCTSPGVWTNYEALFPVFYKNVKALNAWSFWTLVLVCALCSDKACWQLPTLHCLSLAFFFCTRLFCQRCFLVVSTVQVINFIRDFHFDMIWMWSRCFLWEVTLVFTALRLRIWALTAISGEIEVVWKDNAWAGLFFYTFFFGMFVPVCLAKCRVACMPPVSGRIIVH